MLKLSNQSGASFRSDLNNALAAILSNNSNATSPSTTAAYSIWADTNAAKLKIRNSANDDWVDLINLDGTIARDLTFTGSSANILFDQSDNALEFNDNAKATFGTGADLTISHNGSNSIINDTGTGELQLQRGGNTILSLGSTGIEITDPNGAAEVKLTGFEGSSAQLTLIADEGDDNADTWTIQSFVTDNTLRFLSKASGSLVEKWHITTDGEVEQTGRLAVGLGVRTTDVATNISAGLIQTDGNIDLRFAGVNTDPAGGRYINFMNTDTTIVVDQIMGGFNFISSDSDASGVMASMKLHAASNSSKRCQFRFRGNDAELARLGAGSLGGAFILNTSTGVTQANATFDGRVAIRNSAFNSDQITKLTSVGFSYTTSTSAVDVLGFQNFGGGAAEITVFRRDNTSPAGASIDKLYVAFGGSGSNITSAAIVTAQTLRRGSIHNITYTITENNVTAALQATCDDNTGEAQTLCFFVVSHGASGHMITGF